jgi:hypothetical protein
MALLNRARTGVLGNLKDSADSTDQHRSQKIPWSSKAIMIFSDPYSSMRICGQLLHARSSAAESLQTPKPLPHALDAAVDLPS